MLSEFTTVLREKVYPTDLQQSLQIDVKCKKKCMYDSYFCIRFL